MRTIVFAVAVLSMGTLPLAPARGEILPSFHLSSAARAAADIVVVEEGKIAEVWTGDLQVGEPSRTDLPMPRAEKVAYGFLSDGQAEIDRQLVERGLARVATVTGKRLVLFLPPEPAKRHEERMLTEHHACSTVWLEGGQAFAIQQWINPGPAEMRPVEGLTEAELKQVVLELREVDGKLRKIEAVEDRAERAGALVALLRPGNRWWNDEVKESIRRCGKEAWRAIEPLLIDQQHLPLHAELIYLAHAVAKREARPVFEQLLAQDDEYFRPLDAAGTTYDKNQPPHVHHSHRRSAARWALESQ